MNYAAHYQNLIDRARDRSLAGYRERHHVVPVCLGGADGSENQVELTGHEHYVAHQLLVKMHPTIGALAHAAVWMARRCTGRGAHSWVLRHHARAVSAVMQGNKSWTGRRHTDEWKAARAEAMLGRTMPTDGVEKMAAAKRGKP